MNSLLIFFALPIAVIIISIVLQKLLKCPFLVAGVIFAIFLIVTFAVFNINFLVATIVYTILAFITAWLTMLISQFCSRLRENGCCHDNSGRSGNNPNCGCQNSFGNQDIALLSVANNCCNRRIDDTGNLLTISSNGCNGVENDLLTISTNCPQNTRNTTTVPSNTGCNCQCTTSDNNTIAVSANVIPNNCNNGRTGNFSGCYRRRSN